MGGVAGEIERRRRGQTFAKKRRDRAGRFAPPLLLTKGVAVLCSAEVRDDLLVGDVALEAGRNWAPAVALSVGRPFDARAAHQRVPILSSIERNCFGERTGRDGAGRDGAGPGGWQR